MHRQPCYKESDQVLGTSFVIWLDEMLSENQSEGYSGCRDCRDVCDKVCTCKCNVNYHAVLRLEETRLLLSLKGIPKLNLPVSLCLHLNLNGPINLRSVWRLAKPKPDVCIR